jgi:hypothetical protein
MPRTFVNAPRSLASARRPATKRSPCCAMFSHELSSTMISMKRWLRTMSDRLPPHVELMRLGTWKTLSRTSSTRVPA